MRSPNDPRNQSPAVGTGGPEGGQPVFLLFTTVQRCARGEFTFSIAYSNFDRDPGNVDITDMPLSFNVGVERSPRALLQDQRLARDQSKQSAESFQLSIFQTRNCSVVPCVVQSAQRSCWRRLGQRGNARGHRSISSVEQSAVRSVSVRRAVPRERLVWRPGQIGQQFGFPGFNALLGPPVVQPNSGTFGSADNFPGIGSPVGGILPGVVLATTVLPATR